GVVVRVCLLSQPMRNDEALTFLYYSSKPLSMALSDYSLPNNLLFHTFLVRLAYLLLGNEPWSLRLPAFIAGTLLIPAAYLLAHRLYNRHAALLSAALVACSSILIEFTTNARGYTLICLITLLVFALATILYRSTSALAWGLFVALSVVGFYTIPIMVYPFSAAIIWLFSLVILDNHSTLRTRQIQRLFFVLIAVIVLTISLYLPVFLSSGIEP